MTACAKPIATFLSASPNARQLGAMDLGAGRGASIWRNHDDRMFYATPIGHTFSFYLSGGTGTSRLDGGTVHGWPGAVSIMPHGQPSDWEITDPFYFIHLYIGDGELRRAYSETFDTDARLMDLTDLTYFDAPRLGSPFRTLHQATVRGDPLMADEAVAELIHGVFTDPRCMRAHPSQLTGGLSPHHRRRVQDYLADNMGRSVTLRELASLSDLSEFHLQRSFRQSCGVSPHTWIQHHRIESAKSMIAAGASLMDVVVTCGFSSQSHLTRTFKSAVGMTPGAYAKRV